MRLFVFFFQAEDGIRDGRVTGVQTCALPISDLRSEMVRMLIRCGIQVEMQHHEVGTAGQAEIDIRFAPLLQMADNLMLYKYVVKCVARAAGKTVTFMPKPLFGDNGSGMHCHQSLWKDGAPLIYDEVGYA